MKKTIIIISFIVFLLTVSVCFAEGDQSVYDRAKSLYENKQYYEAHKLFIQSQYGDWERMANKCVRPWPKNGEIYHDSSEWLRDTQLTFKVDQPADTAVFIRVYKVENKSEKPVSYVFIGGSDEVTIYLPGNSTYTIRDGVGSNWYGEVDTFGAEGAYETMLFGRNEEETYYFEQKLDYTITINVEDVIGEEVGSEDAEWKSFTE